MSAAHILPAMLALLETLPAGADVSAICRERWPDWRFTQCSTEDIPARLRPAATGKDFELYWIGGGEHCLALTDDPEQAIGMVLAALES